MTPRSFAFPLFALVLGVPLLFHARERARSARAAQTSSTSSATSLPGRSIYRLRSAWTTDDGKTIRLSELRDEPRILALIFTSCPRACPTLVKQLQTLERRLQDGPQAAKFVLISIDPERDSTAVLHAYRKRMGLGERWTLLRGSAADVRELAVTLGFGYGTDDSSQLVHSKLVTVLDADGEILHQQAEPGPDPERLLEAVQGAQRGRVRCIDQPRRHLSRTSSTHGASSLPRANWACGF
jgi:protein SCO1/2